MATNQQNNLFAPPSQEELSGDSDMFAPPKQDELFAPPTQSELQGASPKQEAPEAPTPDMLKDEDFQKLGQKYGVDPEQLRNLAPYYGATAAPRSLGEAATQGLKASAGFAGRSLGFNLPQKEYASLQSPQMQQALSELQETGKKQRGLLDSAAEIAAMPVAGAGGSALSRLGSAAVVGGGIGLGESKPGQEVPETLKGAALGGGLGLGGEAASWLFSKAAKLAPAEKNAITATGIDLDKGAQEIAEKNADSNAIIKDVGMGQKTALSPDEVDTVLNEQLGPDVVDKYLDPATMEGQQIRDQIEGPITDQSIKHQLVDEVIGERYKNFAEYLTGDSFKDTDKAIEAISDVASREGAEATAKRYDNFMDLNNALEHIEDKGLVSKDQPGFFGQAANKMSDTQYVLRWLDEKYGIRSEDALRELNKANNRYTFARQDTRRKLQDIFDTAKKLDLDDEVTNSRKIYDALDTGNRAGLSDAENQVADKFKQYFEDSRNFVNDTVRTKDPNISPLSIPKLENYVPKVAKPIDEIIPIVEGKVEDTLSELSGKYDRKIESLGDLTKPEFADALKNGDLDELVDFAKWTNPSTEVNSGADLNRIISDQLYTRDGQIGIESRARAAMAREGQIPDMILETNLYKLADKWSLNTLKHLYLRNSMDKLAVQGKKLDALGAAPESQYITNLLQDIKGVRKGTAAEGIMQAKIQAARNLDQMIDKTTDPVKKLVLTTARSIPDLMYAATRQLYPNVLGWNFHSALMHSAVSFGRIAPELGGTYGYSAMMRGAMNAVANMGKFHDLAQKFGNIPASFIRDGENALAQGIARSGVFQKIAGANQALGKVGMSLFQAGETWNRSLVLGTAEVMARDIARGSQAALNSLSRFPKSVRDQVLANPKDAEAVFNVLGKYLNDTTMFNYNRASMFELGRTLGPVLSTFSKWPTAVAGEAIYELRSKGLLKGMARNMERLVVPYLMLSAAQYGLFGAPGDMSDREKKAIGAKGLAGLAPIGALHEFTSGKQFTPPAVDIVYNGVIKPALEGNASKAGYGLDNMLKSYTPQAGLLRGITDDLVTYVTGRRPEGKTFVERTAEGARQITH